MRKFKADLRTLDLMTALEFVAMVGFLSMMALFADIKTGVI